MKKFTVVLFLVALFISFTEPINIIKDEHLKLFSSNIYNQHYTSFCFVFSARGGAKVCFVSCFGFFTRLLLLLNDYPASVLKYALLRLVLTHGVFTILEGVEQQLRLNV